MTNIEIPYKEDRDFKYRLSEILPGAISWTIIITPFALSFINPTWAAYFIILFMLAWLVKAFGYAFRTTQGFNRMQKYMKHNWSGLLDDLNHPKQRLARAKENDSEFDKEHLRNLTHYASLENPVKPTDIYQAVIVASYNESLDTLEPTVKALLETSFDSKKIMVIMAYELRNGAKSQPAAEYLVKTYGNQFKHAMAVPHPVAPREVKGKGGNITYAARKLKKYIDEQNIDPAHVLVTTLDADHRTHYHYFASLTYNYLIDEDHKYKSYQPIPMFLNNIWDAPAPNRVMAVGNSFWNLIVSGRPHLMRNFAAHTQSLETLIDTDFWSVRTIVEDGHQFWRTYFRYNGRHEVIPIYTPVFQDAVLGETYLKTLKAQFIQLRRWAWGASDIAYFIDKGYRVKNSIPGRDKLFKLTRLMEAHISWATAPLILAGSAWLPILINPEAQDSIVAHQLPRLASNINTIIAGGILVTVFLSMRMLPPRPPRYKAHRNIFMVLQWVLMPLTSIVYGSFAALTSQTRLMFARYLDKFDVTEKVVKK